jgi:hypothetical protein
MTGLMARNFQILITKKKIEENPIDTATGFLGLDKLNNCIINNALLDLVSSNISVLNVSISNSPVVTREI